MKSKWFAHDVDNMGFPTDPTLRHLEDELANLAVMYRDNQKHHEKATQIAKQYRVILLHMYELGWDADLHPEAQLPDEFMPEEWFEHNPEYRE